MLKVSCNVSDQLYAFLPSSKPKGKAKAPAHLFRQRCGGVSCSLVRRAPAQTSLRAVVNADQVNSGTVTAVDPAQLGRLMEDGFSYKEKFIVRCYEVGFNKTATVETIANLLQEVACNHAQSVGCSTDGFATTNTMRKYHLIWVTARMHIEMYKYPTWSDVIEIETWIQGEGKNTTRRDWIIKDCATDGIIGRATSKWVMMNEDTRRLTRVTDEVRESYLVFSPPEPRLSFPDKNHRSSKKISKLEDPAEYSKLMLKTRRSDLDMNQHVNNVTYIGWVLESMPQEILDSHELEVLTLDYRRECQREDIVDSLTTLEISEEHVSKESSTLGLDEGMSFLHLLRLSENGQEINRGRTLWRKKK